MKKLSIAACFLLLSCKKETLNAVTHLPELAVIDTTLHISPIIYLNTYEKSYRMSGNTQIVSYSVIQPVSVEITPDLLNVNKSNIQLKLNGKTINVVSIHNVYGGIASIKLQSPAGLLYYSLNFNTLTKEVTNISMLNPIPYEQLSTTRFPITSDRTIYDCLKKDVELCKSSWLCKIVFGSNIIGLSSASIGWTFGCIFYPHHS